ncbi:PBP1A family penicillin-binding protein [Microaerobacter geothermalis]|uniref:PBP1A family penicillin-binding protein n=1 Tax=Microaerobacter geothermalis TaxID=674972 RepID=UPI001F34BFDC|nr:PBP1A family penicillin-binding protein [Microaerobacter geothermalis]MCF6094911.1 PBP1A family penicillin-binding protein [Microaerobacter geothermalis]
MNQSSKQGKGKKRKKNIGKKIWTIFSILLLLILMGGLFAGGAVAGYVASVLKEEPVRPYEEIRDAIFSNYLTGFAYFKDGSPIGQLRAEEDRRLVTQEEVSDYLINAIIATEDKYFYEHRGIVPKAIIRAAIEYVTGSTNQSGGSTITQQLVKNTILTPEKEIKRKVKEAFLALRIERMFSKKQILEAYLNEIYFGINANGSNIYGIQAAAKGIFGVDAKELNLPQAAYLAGIPQNPAAYSPFNEEGLKRGKERQKTVLNRMLENGFITKQQYEDALAYDIQGNLAPPKERAYTKYPFLMMEIEDRAARALVEAQLKEKNITKDELSKEQYRQMLQKAKKDILTGGYRIYTTIDKDIHELMTEISSNPANFGPNATYQVIGANGQKEMVKDALEEVGAVLIENKTGAILGFMGGRNFKVSEVNHTTRPRQPGSAMKPIAAYAPAIEEKLLQPASIIDDVPLILPDGEKGEHVPENWDYKFHGLITARHALNQSYNIPAIKVYKQVGIPKALEYLKKMGVTTLVEQDQYAQTGVIGGLTYGLTVEEITNAYATFGNQGTFVDAYLIDRIENKDGDVIYQHEIEPKPVFSPQTAYLITDMLRTVINNGTGQSVRKYVGNKRDIAGKTGTTNNSNDLWFVGYSPELTMGVWIGYDKPYTLPKVSNTRPKDIWGKVMAKLYEIKPELTPENSRFVMPDGIVRQSVDSKSGKLPSELSEEAGTIITDLFTKDMVPTEIEDVLQRGRAVIINNKSYLAQENTPDDMVISKIFFKREPYQIPKELPDYLKNKFSSPEEHYRPLDWQDELPTELDPRVDDGLPPSTPRDVKVVKEGNDIALTWESNTESDVVGYRIYRAQYGTNNFTKAGVILQHEEKKFVDPEAKPGSAYGYYLVSVDVAGNISSPTPVILVNRTSGNITNPWGDLMFPQGDASALPSSPKGLRVEKSIVGVELNWNQNHPSEQVTGYNIYYSESPNSGFQRLGFTTTTSYTHISFKKEILWYRITAVNALGESLPSVVINSNGEPYTPSTEDANPDRNNTYDHVNDNTTNPENNMGNGSSDPGGNSDSINPPDSNDNLLNLPGDLLPGSGN